ncbi:MAG: S24 family peptidase [bacterium]|nr:S24 family peptidase [bacterium]
MIHKPLTYKQQRVLGSIKEHVQGKNEVPTLEQLRSTLGFSSLRTVTQYLDTLEEKGYIVRRRGLKRNIELRNVDGGWGTVSVPVVANVGCDDLSVFSQAEGTVSTGGAVGNTGHDEFLEIDRQIVQDAGGDIVAVRAIGNSMNDAGINTGDYVLIRFTDEAQNGDRVAAIVNDMVTVKRLERRPSSRGEPGMTVLWPESKDPKFKPIILREDFKIAGKVLCVIPAPGVELTEVVPINESDWQ